MNNTRSFMTATALGTLTAAAALLVGLSGAQAQAPAPGPALSGAGSFPLSFVVPGTNTSLHVGGFAQMDLRYSMGAYSNSASPGAYFNENPTAVLVAGPGEATALPPSLPTSAHGVLYFTGQGTRLQVETRTPSDYGEIKTFVEMDFSGSVSTSSNATGATGTTQEPSNFLDVPRLKQAYGVMGPWLFGQAASNYADLAAWPQGITAAGGVGIPDGPGTVFVPQIRYTYLLPYGISTSGSVEYNDAGGELLNASTGTSPISATTGVGFNDYNAPGLSGKWPAFTGTGRIDQPWGHAAIHLVVGNTRLQNLYSAFGSATKIPGLGTGGDVSRWGWQSSLTGHLNTIGKDALFYNFEIGQGADGYDWDLQNLGGQYIEDLICVSNPAPVNSLTCGQMRNIGGDIGYVHYWTNEWRSTANFGYNRDYRPSSATPGAFATPTAAATGLYNLERRHLSATAGLLWTPVAGVQLGLEYDWFHRVMQSGAQGSANILEFQTLFAF
jgi:hypothetical protein